MRAGLRLLCAVALGTALVLPATLILAGDPGRDTTRCLQACRSIKTACDDGCNVQCPAMFPNSFEERYACLRTCLTSCADRERECASQCGIDRPPTSPTAP